MQAYLINRTDLSILGAYEVTSFTLYPGSATAGQVALPATASVDTSGSFLYFDAALWNVTGATPKDGKTTVKVKDIATAFDREIIYGSAGTSVEKFIADTLTASYKNESDAVYAMSYLSISYTASTAFVEPELDDANTFKLSDYIEAARASGVGVSFTYSPGTLTVSIEAGSSDAVPILLGDGINQLQSEQYTSDKTAKITVRQEDGSDPPVFTDYTYYLASDGTISTSVPASRESGTWRTVKCSSSDTPLDVATELFGENEVSYKIEFYSTKELALYTPVKLRFERGTVFESRISQIKKTSGDSRTLYTCGTMPTTLTDILANKETKK